MSKPCDCSEWPEIAKVLVWLTPEDAEELRVRPFILDDGGEPIYVLFCPSCGGEAPQQVAAESLGEMQVGGLESLAEFIG